jgi:soluble lytic murein transglycosylase-like protein
MHLPPSLARYEQFFVSSGHRHGIDPALLAGICWRESRGGDALTPKGPGGTGDCGHGRGLCQIDDRFHHDFIERLLPSGEHAWKDPASNIDYAAEVLKGFIEHFKGDERLAVAAYNAGAKGVARAIAAGHSPDMATTGHDYSTAVLAYRTTFA